MSQLSRPPLRNTMTTSTVSRVRIGRNRRVRINRNHRVRISRVPQSKRRRLRLGPRREQPQLHRVMGTQDLLLLARWPPEAQRAVQPTQSLLGARPRQTRFLEPQGAPLAGQGASPVCSLQRSRVRQRQQDRSRYQ